MALGIDIYHRFWSKVDLSNLSGCWLWTASKTRHEYGNFGLAGRNDYAHRVAYTMLLGPIPDGLQLDHLCRIANCVNPFHLEPVTNRENGARGQAAEVQRARHAARTHCKRGHAFTSDNVRMARLSTGYMVRRCRACVRMHARNARSRRVQKVG